MSEARSENQSGVGGWVLAGLGAGLGAGAIFIVVEVIQAALLGAGPLGPLRLIGAIGLGMESLPPPPVAAVGTVVPVALLIHFTMSALYGVGFGATVGMVGVLRRSRSALIGAALVSGFLLWLVNFNLISPLVFPWFAMVNTLVQVILHTVFFGLPLGLLLAPRAGEE
jgi:hypothetical protein